MEFVMKLISKFFFSQIAIKIFLACQIASSTVLAEKEAFTRYSSRVSNTFPVNSRDRLKLIKFKKNTVLSDCDSKLGQGKTFSASDVLEKDLSFESIDIFKQVRFNNNLKVSEIPTELLQLVAQPRSQVPTTFLRQNRTKRAILGHDSQYFLSSKKFALVYPFSTVVKISTGCTGVQLSSKHILTAARCIHNGKNYIQVRNDKQKKLTNIYIKNCC